MFVLSEEVVKKILERKLDYNEIPYNKVNEVSKGLRFEDQAKVNLKLSKTHVAMCLASGEKCMMEGCRLFVRKSGKILGGWVCREFKVDFPEAVFNERFHIALIGDDRVDRDATKKRLKELKNKGANYICLNCKQIYAEKPVQLYEDGHGGKDIEMCSCGSDLFDDIGPFIKRL